MKDSGEQLTVLVMAKAPVPGLAKTRLMKHMSAADAAAIAAAALLDTLAAVSRTPAAHRVVAMTGEVADAMRSKEVATALKDFTVLEQHGDRFADRLVNAHADAYRGTPVVQIGMDTPQLTPNHLIAAGRALTRFPCVLGPATDGGWWALGIDHPSAAKVLTYVPMSQPDTGALTKQALEASGVVVRLLLPLTDADEFADLAVVAGQCRPDSHFRNAVSAIGSRL